NLRTGRSNSIRPSGPQAQGQRGNPQPPEAQGQRGAQPPEAADPEQAQALAAQFGGGRGNPNGNVVPTPPAGTNFRFYWNTPFALSPHNPATIFLGGDRLFRSYNRGDTWLASPDLTSNVGRNDRPIMGVDGKAPMASKHDGAASYSNIVTISESYVLPGVLWIGTNDGNVQVSRDGGATWKNVVDKVPGVPKETHVSRVETSHFDAGTAYVTFDGHRTDDHKAYVFMTKDFGETWTSLTGDLPAANVNVIREDPKNRNLLYLGNEYGFYISLDGGKAWKRFMNGLPTVRIDDILIHPRDNDLILGTHGRSIWIIDDISALQQMTPAVQTADATLFDVRPATAYATDVQKSILVEGAKVFRGQNPARGSAISYWLKSAPAGDVKISIADVTGREIRTIQGTKNAGLNRVQWDLAPTGAAGRGRGAGGADAGGGRGAANAPAAAAPPGAGAPPGAPAPATAPPGAPATITPAAGTTAGGGAPTQFPVPAAAAQGRQGGGGGRGGFAQPVPPGTYLVKLMVGDKVVGQKTVVVEADTTFMQ
ncbi:MAG: hypothetical protein ACJ786_06815, partial [Catenulispora sp.]